MARPARLRRRLNLLTECFVRLSKLKLAGFKTFVDPTTIMTPGSLVGVVGPNGCGKSNVIDAVRWVLGETRASALRGESMQDVIFNGSTTRKPVSRASVELVFDNAEGKAAGQWSRYAEISVKRMLDRSGESSYFINGVHVRRKDVIDLFLGTGLGPRAYAIIEQGMISRIIEARPEEVRGFLEEAAGVTKYRERRRETEGRLTDARDNLTRLDDIRTELAERIGYLDEQARVAARYSELSAAHTQRQQLLWLLKLDQAQREHERLQNELHAASQRMEQDSLRLQELESIVETARTAHFDAAEATHLAQSDLFAVSAEVARLESELRHLHDTRKRLEARVTELSAEQTHWQSRRQTLEGETARWQELFENATLRVEQITGRHEEAAIRLPESEEGRRIAEATLNAARRELTQTEQQLRVEETRRNSAMRTLETLGTRRARLESDGGAFDAPDETALQTQEQRADALQALFDKQQQQLHDIQVRMPVAQAMLRQALEQEKAGQRLLAELRARHDALLQLQQRARTQGQLGAWLERHGLTALEPLWQSVRITAGWEKAIGAILRERLRALTGDVSGAVTALLDDTPGDSVALLLAAPMRAAEAASAAAPDGSVAASDCVGASAAEVRAVLGNWLAGCFLVDDVARWVDRRDALAAGVHLVDRGGRILSCDALLHYADDDRTEGMIERQREIEELAAKLPPLEQELQAAHDAFINADNEAAELDELGGALRREMQNVQQQLHAEQVALLKMQQACQRAKEKQEQLARDLVDLQQQEAGERDFLSAAEAEFARCAELIELQRNRLDASQEVFDERERRLQEVRALEQSIARELQETRFSERECAGKIDDIAHNVRLADEQLRRIDGELVNCRHELEATGGEDSQQALQEVLALRQRRESALAICRDRQEEAGAHLRHSEEQRLRVEQEAAPLRTRVAELRLALQAAELATAQFAERLDEVDADRVALQPLLNDNINEVALQREVSRLARDIAALGQVNMAALEELNNATARKNYLDAQYLDLTEAIATLEDAIRRIDRETREQLQETYNTVTLHFGQLFPQLFGGGQARLVLTGEEILDAGIQIVAQPPGKKNTSIHLLSGGEKALTAIALVFSMFQLNPAPFCMLDEVDAPLDDANTGRYCEMVRRMSSQTQFIFISHSKITMEIAQQLVGVTMQEQGVSRVVEVDIEEALRLAETATA